MLTMGKIILITNLTRSISEFIIEENIGADTGQDIIMYISTRILDRLVFTGLTGGVTQIMGSL